MPDLSIIMPSHRSLEGARAPIDSALRYCAARDAVLIVADNSGDPAKRLHYADGPGPLVWLDTGDAPIFANLVLALDAATTPFVMPMGDDDAIEVVEGEPPFDLSSLANDHVGVFPRSLVFSARHGVMQTKSFAVSAEDADGRMEQYIAGSKGNNSLYYSMFRREVYQPLMHTFVAHHPTRGLYSDWALLLSLVCYGKMAHDPSTQFRYNMENWDSAEKIAETRERHLREAGLPPEAVRFEALLMYLDTFVFVMRLAGPVPKAERPKLGAAITRRLLGSFLAKVAAEPEGYDETTRHLAAMASEEPDSFTRFQIALLMVDRLQAGLKDRYLAFVRALMAPA